MKCSPADRHEVVRVPADHKRRLEDPSGTIQGAEVPPNAERIHREQLHTEHPRP